MNVLAFDLQIFFKIAFYRELVMPAFVQPDRRRFDRVDIGFSSSDSHCRKVMPPLVMSDTDLK